MAQTIYSSFSEPSSAEKAAGALLDFGVRAEDISLVRNHHAAMESGAEQRDPATAGISPSAAIADASKMAHNDPAGIGRSTVEYADTTRTGLWEGSSGDPDSDRLTYTGSAQMDTAAGSVYGTDWKPKEGSIDEYERAAKEGISTTTAADAGAGAVSGLGWGVGVGVLAGLASLLVPGVGLVTGGGALAAAIGAAAATAGAGALTGAVTGYLKDQGMDEHLAASYSDGVGSGGALLAVTVPSGQVDETTVRQILDKYGAEAVSKYASRGYVA